MVYLGLLYAVAFPFLLGYSFINIFLNKRDDISNMERLALGFCIGLILITAEMYFVLPKFNVRYSVLAISSPFIPIILYGLFVTIKNGIIGSIRGPISDLYQKWKSLRPIEILLIFLILLQILFVSLSLFIKPVSGWDAWQGYSLRAKAYFIEGTTNINVSAFAERGQHVALSQTWVFTCIGQWHEIIGKVNCLIYFLALLIIFFFSAKRVNSRAISLISTYMLATLPFLVHHASLEYCDFIIGIYLFIGVSLMHLWYNHPKTRYFLLSMIFLFAMVTIKKEGYFHLAIVFSLFSLIIFSNRFNNTARIKLYRSILAVSIIALVCYILQYTILKPFENTSYSALPDIHRLLPMLSAFGDLMFVRNNWGIAWAILLVLLMFNFAHLKKNGCFFLFGIIFLELFGFMVFYLLVQRNVYEFLFFVTPAVRNMLQFMPIVMLLIACLLNFDMPEVSVGITSKRKR